MTGRMVEQENLGAPKARRSMLGRQVGIETLNGNVLDVEVLLAKLLRS